MYLCIIFNYERTNFFKYYRNNIEFLDRYLVHSGFFLPESITTAGDDIFWTRRESNVLYSINYKNNNRFFNHVALRKFI